MPSFLSPSTMYAYAKAPKPKDAGAQLAASRKQFQKWKTEQAKKKKPKPKVTTTTTTTTPAAAGNEAPPSQPDKDYKWNLPPHTWSLPVKPDTQNDFVNAIGDIEKYRRGRMWWYASTTQDFVDANGKTVDKDSHDRRYGFQFLWNPESYTTAVQLNSDATPSVQDRFVGVAGAFPSGEAISFTLRLDRTTDFACMRGLLKRNYLSNSVVPSSITANVREGRVDTNSLAGVLAASSTSAQTTNPNVYKDMMKYYKTSFSENIPEAQMLQQIKDLMELGTISDIEYLYKAINGSGWTNVIGRETSDIGFLSATVLRVEIGPLSYVGYVTSLNVSHIAFSQDMTPIRTDVNVSMNLMASAGVAKTGTANSISLNGGTS